MFKARFEDFAVFKSVVGFWNCVTELAGGIYVAADYIRNRHTALHTALPAENYGLNLVVLGKIFTVDKSTRIYYDNRLFECDGNSVDKAFFNGGKIIVAVNGTSVNALGGKTAKGYNRSIGICGGIGNQLVGCIRFGDVHFVKGVINNIVTLLAEIHHIYYAPTLLDLLTGENIFALTFNIIFIIINARHIKLDLALDLLLSKAVIDIVSIGAINVAASAATLDVFD